jgi:hypothetical protein
MSAPVIKIEIGHMAMGQHFLYLPTFYAVHEKFFGYLPAGVELEKHPAPRRSDDSVFDMLMDIHAAQHLQVLFAICDPAVLLKPRRTLGPTPVLLGGLVTNLAFWAIDTGRQATRSFADLGDFDKIISFPNGSTSHGIASRVARSSRSNIKIVEVQPGDELSRLEEVAGEEKSTVALTPDVLGWQALLSRRREFNVEIELAKTPEYFGVLATGLFTRSDVLHDNRDVCIGVARGVQEALVRLHLRDPKVIAYAAEAHDTTEERARRAIETAIDSHVFPFSLEITQAHWMRTAECAFASAGLDFDQSKRDEAQAVFRQSLEPFIPIAREILRTSVHVGAEAPPPERQPSATGELIVLISGAIMALLSLRALNLFGNYGWVPEVIGCTVVIALLPGAIAFAKHRTTMWLLRALMAGFAIEQMLAYSGALPKRIDTFVATALGTLIIGTFARHFSR